MNRKRKLKSKLFASVPRRRGDEPEWLKIFGGSANPFPAGAGMNRGRASRFGRVVSA